MQPKNIQAFLTLFEWGVMLTFVIESTVIAESQGGLFTCGVSALTLLILGLMTTVVRSRAVLVTCALVLIVASFTATAIFFGGSILLLVTPILGIIYMRRLIKFQDRDDYSRMIVSRFYFESFVIPLLIVVIELFISHVNAEAVFFVHPYEETFIQYVPPYVFGIGVIAYVGLRIISLTVLERLENGRSLFNKQSFVFTVFVMALYSLIGIALSFTRDDVQYTHFIDRKVIDNRQGKTMTITGGITQKEFHLNFTLHWWEILLALIAIIGVFAYLNRKKKIGKILLDQKDNDDLIEIKRERVSRSPRIGSLFSRTNSHVRRRYQEMLRFMDKRGFPARPPETVREYSERLEGRYTTTNSDGFEQGMKLLKGAYEETRYTPDEVESDALKQQAERGLKLLKNALDKSVSPKK